MCHEHGIRRAKAKFTHTLVAALADLYGNDFARHVGRNVNSVPVTVLLHNCWRLPTLATNNQPVDPGQNTIARKYQVKMPIGLEPCDNDNVRGAWP